MILSVEMDQGDHYLAQIQCPKSFCAGFPTCLMHHRDASKNRNTLSDDVKNNSTRNTIENVPSDGQSIDTGEESQPPETDSITNEAEELNEVEEKDVDDVQENRYSRRTRQRTVKLIESQAQSPPKKTQKTKGTACCEALKIKLQKAEQKVNTNEKHLETLRSSLANKETIIQAQSKIIEDNKRTVENLKKNVSTNEDTENEKTILKTRISELEKEIKERDVQLETHRSLAYSFMDELQNSENDKSEGCNQDLEAARIVIKELEEDNKALQMKVETMYKENVDLKTKISEVEKLKSSLSAVEKRNGDLQMKAKSYEDHIKELNLTKESFAQATSELQSLESRLIESEQVQECLRSEIATLKKTPTKTVDKEQQSDTYNDHSDRACCQNKKELAALQELLSKNPESREQLTIISKLKDLVQERDKNIESLKDHEAFMTEEYVSNMGLIKKLKNDSHQLKEDLNSCQVKIKSIEHVNSELKLKANRQGEQVALLLKVNDVQKSSTAPSPTRDHPPNQRHKEEYCFAELRNKGSCRNGGRCKYSHEIPRDIRGDQSKIFSIINRKNICVNEFKSQNNCKKGNNCKFWHGFSQSERDDEDLLKYVERKLERMNNERSKDNVSQLFNHIYANKAVVPSFPPIQVPLNPTVKNKTQNNSIASRNQQVLYASHP